MKPKKFKSHVLNVRDFKEKHKKGKRDNKKKKGSLHLKNTKKKKG